LVTIFCVGASMRRPAVSFCWNVERVGLFLAALSRIALYTLDALSARRSSNRRTSRHGVSLIAALSLCGCSAGPVIGLYAADYRDTTANAGDAQLLLNILRAKDNLPIHFYDLSNIHGSVQWSAGAGASVPFALNNSATPATAAPLVSLQNNPSFDVGTSDTQDFTRGILSQIDPIVVKAFFDQGVDPRIMLLLFFSQYINPRGEVFLNNTSCDASDPGQHPERGCLNQLYGYLGQIDHLAAKAGVNGLNGVNLQANVYTALRPMGPALLGVWTLKDNFSDLSKFDTTKYKLIDRRLYSVSESRLAICNKRNGKLIPLIPSPTDDVCTRTEVVLPESSFTRKSGLQLRSTYDIIQYLGQILRFQEEKGRNRCVTLTGKTEADRQCDTGEVLFQVNAPVGAPVVGTRYRDGWYALYDRSCSKDLQQPCDYSLQALAVLELLLNENRAAKNIVATPRVQVVQ
jgi:hypothetical protein